MKLLTRNTDYAVRAICALAKRRGDTVSVTELVRELKIPRPFLRKILQTLTRRGLVASYKGMGGGFRLAEPALGIRLSGLISIFQGPLRVNECKLRKKACPNTASCPLKSRIDDIERRVVNELSAITIGSLLKGR